MIVNGKHYRSIWLDDDDQVIRAIDQTLLPHKFAVIELRSLDDACNAILDMQVRGAPLIGITAAYGMYLAVKEVSAGSVSENVIRERAKAARKRLLATRPTAVNLLWALQRVDEVIEKRQSESLADSILKLANDLAAEDIAICQKIGDYGLSLLDELWHNRSTSQEVLNVLTHCNAGWLATVDWGTALAPIYKAQQRGIPVHVWVDETRPRNQGAYLTAWELQQQDIPHTVIVDNMGGHLMRLGRVDLCLVGSDRTTASGDVCNKIGTYLKALAAFDNGVPFYVALPISSIDFSIHDGLKDITVEERGASEVSTVTGLTEAGKLETVRLTPQGSPAANYAFDVTPARLVTGLITEKGIFSANRESLQALSNA